MLHSAFTAATRYGVEFAPVPLVRQDGETSFGQINAKIFEYSPAQDRKTTSGGDKSRKWGEFLGSASEFHPAVKKPCSSLRGEPDGKLRQSNTRPWPE